MLTANHSRVPSSLAERDSSPKSYVTAMTIIEYKLESKPRSCGCGNLKCGIFCLSTFRWQAEKLSKGGIPCINTFRWQADSPFGAQSNQHTKAQNLT